MKNYVKYIIFAGIIYAVLKVVPTKQLNNLEIISLVCVILVGIFSLECLTTNKSENMKDLRENMTEPKLFDLDMDIDLDFNKTSKGIKETHNVTGSKKSKDALSDIIKKSKKKLLPEEELTEEEIKEIKKKKITSKAKDLGIDMQAVEDELRKRQIVQAIENEELSEEELKDKIREIKKAELKDKIIEEERKQEARRQKIKEEREEREYEEEEEAIENAKIEKEERERKRKLEEQVKKKLQTYSDKASVNCEVEVAKMRREMQDTISKLKQEIASQSVKSEQSPFAKKYMSILIADLLENRIIDSDDVENINAKLISGAITTNDAIKSLEKLRSIGRPKKVSKPKDRQNDMKYSDLPADYYKPLGDKIANQWDNEYTILNTDKWQVPQPRPPVCISNGPCKVCPTHTDGYGVNLKEWDDSRVVSNHKINKKWAKDQAKS